MKPTIIINGREVGGENPCYVIAEIGTNHDRDIEKAKMLVKAAAEAGVDAVKFQIYEASDIVNARIMPREYGLEDLYPGMTMMEVFEKHLSTPRQWMPELCAYADKIGVTPLATAHSGDGAKFIAEMGMAAVKIASMDVNNLPVLADIADASDLPVIFSTGTAWLDEITETVRLFERKGRDYAILHCVANYPANPEDLHLSNIAVLQAAFNAPVGFSDHSLSPTSAVVARTLGASILEKHITLDRSSQGPDHPFALEPGEFKSLVVALREAEAAYSPSARFIGPGERESVKRILYRRSLVAARNIAAGQVIQPGDVKISRPGSGIEPKMLGVVHGRKAARDITAETPITWEMV